jgi:hypothetical protein
LPSKLNMRRLLLCAYPDPAQLYCHIMLCTVSIQ